MKIAASSKWKNPAPIFGRAFEFLRWNRASYVLFSLLAATILLIIFVWQPLLTDYLATADPRYPLWQQLDWLLLGIFAVMSLLIMAGPDLRADLRIVLIGFVGGLVIESWGTQTNLWTYYTFERPPLWIIPAWPVASLAIDRLYRLLLRVSGVSAGGKPAGAGAGAPLGRASGMVRAIYWAIFGGFYLLMLAFVWPTLDKSLTLAALLLCALLILSPGDQRGAIFTFAAGTGLGYFLERWGTTRECWTYYTHATPPFFAVLAHGMAAVAFWRAGLLWLRVSPRLSSGAGRWAERVWRPASKFVSVDKN